MKQMFIFIAIALALTGCDNHNLDKSVTDSTRQEALTNYQTLNKIQKTGKVVIGYRDKSVPFSYNIPSQSEPVGYAIDIQKSIVTAIKKQLNNPNLIVEYQPISAQERIKKVASGEVDFECSNTSNTPERRKMVDFSVGYFVTGSRLMVEKNSKIKDFIDVNHKKVAVIQGSTTEKILADYVALNQFDTQLIAVKNSRDLINVLETQVVDAIDSDEILLYANRQQTKNPNKWNIVGQSAQFEIYACTLAHNDKVFKSLMDNTLRELYATGEIRQYYQRWFMSPIPPSNMNLNFALSAEMQSLYEHPHDNPLPLSVSDATTHLAEAINSNNKVNEPNR
ncbi:MULTISPECIES: transporter substrate-binding domain-containing protein [unclassified Moraxella]|uniref:transporter substrate-binding domain-containing protein n=1 Tax=unclassified Moraxella TaxID=2685852 RepID=UPI003AF4A6E1